MRVPNSAAASREMWIEPQGDLVMMPPHSVFLLNNSGGYGIHIDAKDPARIVVADVDAVFLLGLNDEPLFVWGY